MSHVQFSAITSNVFGTLQAAIEIPRLLSKRMSRRLFAYGRHVLNIGSNNLPSQEVSLWLTFVTSVFAPLLAHNWRLLLSRPWYGIDTQEGLLFPREKNGDSRTASAITQSNNEKYGFHGYLYTSHSSSAFGRSTMDGADVVWIHAHGGGFYAGEARQYHHTYMRWVEKAQEDFKMDLRVLAVEYRKTDAFVPFPWQVEPYEWLMDPSQALSTVTPYPGCVDAMYAAYKYVLKSGMKACQVVIAGDSAGGNAAISTCYRIIEETQQPRFSSPAALIMLSPWLDLTRSTSGNSPNQATDWLTTFDSDECQTDAIEQYMGTLIKSASDPRVSPLWRKPIPDLPKQFLSAGRAEVLFSDSKEWAQKTIDVLGEEAIECHFAKGQVHTFAIGGWLADSVVQEVSDWRLLSFVHRQVFRRSERH